ncbi:MAG: O-antigen ligase family protein [Hoeflea sp.]|uniref:O-antigen ligase family protein n=1 Tax=Hoeflea sp. TaxID=1940281 RepID=UPI001D72A4B2|nr:O-antigen ligase family protein [Hoeflea sp.]MBU4531578.1 O-antigen ligase family protein [Alphaproteobacteria bacterium]MBU4544435.1 O-antigen ligase family protein [Alphaproteobacteria bacterium]MBU4550328.1 O-antigen ligase family protein [Alphaproteobacteria bacterium]MBV1724854.1 O-antigen ligase family protein [Hoeflea sp.]MBV1760874.1 O-antigen ligase family protein [Hoeflea sp.]
MLRTVVDFWIRPGFTNYSWVNLVFYSVSLCLAPFIGSAVSVIVISGGVYATLHLVTGRLKWALPRPVILVYFAFVGVFAADVIAAIISPSSMALGEVFENLLFLGFAGIYSITFVDRAKLLDTVEKVAAAASLLSIPTAFLAFGHHVRAELATGNPSVLALVAGILYVLNIGAAGRRWNLSSLVHLAAAACVAYLVILTGTRAMWLALILIPLLSLFFHHSLNRILVGLPILLLLFGGLAGLLTIYSQSFETRVEAVVSDFDAIASGDLSGSLGQRVRIYEAGYSLVLERPVFGYGPGNERQEIAERTLDLSGESIAFSHAHNAVLTTMLRSGLLGLMALAALVIVPVIVAFRARKDQVGKAGCFVLNGIMIVYICSGTVGLMLGHDIHDTVFIAAMCFSLYLVFGRAERPALGKQDRTHF